MSSKRLVVITGALRGLGFQLSKRLVKENAVRLIATSRDPVRSQEALAELQSINPACEVDYHPLRVDSEISSEDFLAWVKQHFGTIDVLVNNAGMSDSQSLAASPEGKAREVLDANFFGLVNLTQKSLPLLSADAKIVNVSSVIGKLQFLSPDLKAYYGDTESQITIEQLKQRANEFIEMRKQGKLVGWKEHPFGTALQVSKVLVNVYNRRILANQVTQQQAAIAAHPGWVSTDLGGPKAPIKPEQGITSMYRAIVEYPYSSEMNGVFLDEKGNKWGY